MPSENARGTYACAQACRPHLVRSGAAGRTSHILTLSPLLKLQPCWFRSHVAYTISKYGKSMCMLNMAAEFRMPGIGVNSL